jgi:hypothetical protein
MIGDGARDRSTGAPESAIRGHPEEIEGVPERAAIRSPAGALTASIPMVTHISCSVARRSGGGGASQLRTDWVMVVFEQRPAT